MAQKRPPQRLTPGRRRRRDSCPLGLHLGWHGGSLLGGGCAQTHAPWGSTLGGTEAHSRTPCCPPAAPVGSPCCLMRRGLPVPRNSREALRRTTFFRIPVVAIQRAVQDIQIHNSMWWAMHVQDPNRLSQPLRRKRHQELHESKRFNRVSEILGPRMCSLVSWISFSFLLQPARRRPRHWRQQAYHWHWCDLALARSTAPASASAR